MSDARRRRILIVTGEASGDLHGANLIRAAAEVDPDLYFFGVGGPRMAAAGCEILIPGEELAVMGLVEVLGHFPVIWRAFQRLKGLFSSESQRPDLLLLIDFPDFNLRLAAAAKAAGIPVLYYVSPQVWAWRQGRVKKIARVVDRLAAIFPFEPPLYAGLDIDVEYVGNPLVDEVRIDRGREELLAAYDLNPSQPVVGIFPGSRHNELRYNFATLMAAATEIAAQRPDVQFLLPAAPTLGTELLRDRVSGSGLAVCVVDDSIYDVANACNAVISVSGTVTLQTALVGTPLAIVYRMSPLTYAIGKRLVRVPFIGLANIVAGRGVAKEFIQDEATPAALADEILKILGDSDYEQQLRKGLKLVSERIGQGGCSVRVAKMASAMCRGEVRRKELHAQQ